MVNIKIVMRPLKFSDINENYISWFADKKVTEFLEARNISIKESQNYLRDGVSRQSYYIYAICDKISGAHIGNIKVGPIKRNDGISDLITVIGNRNYWGKGVGTLAIKIMVRNIFLESGIRKFCASINSNNLGSLNAYTKAGFKVESKLINYFYNNHENISSFSDKIFVVFNNPNYNLKKFKEWTPISLSNIL